MGKEINSIGNVVVEAIKKTGHHPFLFMGAGVSMRYANTPRWEGLLRHFCKEFSGDEFLYDSYANRISEKDYYGLQPNIANFLEQDYNNAVFTQNQFNAFKNKHKELIQKGVSPFKIAVAEFLKKADFNIKDKEIQLLRKIAKRNISGIITTNYDTILERIFDGYKTYVGQEELIFANLAGVGEIYKIHGSVDDPSSIVITENDYKRFEERSAYLIAKVLSIFLEYPVVFLGYSLQDKNIKDIFRVIAKSLSQEKLEILKERLIFVEHSNKETVSEFAVNFENGNIIRMKQLSTTNFAQIYEAIDLVKAKYSPRVLRELRRDIYELANEVKPSGKIVATGFENMDLIDKDTNFVLGIGVSQMGHMPTAEKIYEDIVYDNQFLNPEIVIKEYLPELLKRNSGGLPMFKYIYNYEGELYERVKVNYDRFISIDSFLNDGQRRQKNNYRATLSSVSVDSIIELEGEELAYKRLVFLEEAEFDLQKIEAYLRKCLKGNAKTVLFGNSELKRLIRIYDFVKFRKK